LRIASTLRQFQDGSIPYREYDEKYDASRNNDYTTISKQCVIGNGEVHNVIIDYRRDAPFYWAILNFPGQGLPSDNCIPTIQAVAAYYYCIDANRKLRSATNAINQIGQEIRNEQYSSNYGRLEISDREGVIKIAIHGNAHNYAENLMGNTEAANSLMDLASTLPEKRFAIIITEDDLKARQCCSTVIDGTDAHRQIMVPWETDVDRLKNILPAATIEESALDKVSAIIKKFNAGLELERRKGRSKRANGVADTAFELLEKSGHKSSDLDPIRSTAEKLGLLTV
jgi:hypothetical protein